VITGNQIRKARELLGWPAVELARRAKLRTETIKRAENSDSLLSITIAHAAAIRAAFDEAGIEFTNGEEPSVKLKKV
jgi:transcriptional regulator with XRE-family HTH domain